jgi:hypothetical protein
MYSYEKEREKLFTDNGQRMFLRVRDKAKSLLDTSGAFYAGNVIEGLTGDSWELLACLDRLVELGELAEVPNPVSGAGQHRIFVRA